MTLCARVASWEQGLSTFEVAGKGHITGKPHPLPPPPQPLSVSSPLSPSPPPSLPLLRLLSPAPRLPLWRHILSLGWNHTRFD